MRTLGKCVHAGAPWKLSPSARVSLMNSAGICHGKAFVDSNRPFLCFEDSLGLLMISKCEKHFDEASHCP